MSIFGTIKDAIFGSSTPAPAPAPAAAPEAAAPPPPPPPPAALSEDDIYAVLEKVSRGPRRLDFEKLSADGTAGGWITNINRMDCRAPLLLRPNGAVRRRRRGSTGCGALLIEAGVV